MIRISSTLLSATCDHCMCRLQLRIRRTSRALPTNKDDSTNSVRSSARNGCGAASLCYPWITDAGGWNCICRNAIDHCRTTSTKGSPRKVRYSTVPTVLQNTILYCTLCKKYRTVLRREKGSERESEKLRDCARERGGGKMGNAEVGLFL